MTQILVSHISTTVEAAALKLGRNQKINANECINAKEFFDSVHVVPDFPIDGHKYTYMYWTILILQHLLPSAPSYQLWNH